MKKGMKGGDMRVCHLCGSSAEGTTVQEGSFNYQLNMSNKLFTNFYCYPCLENPKNESKIFYDFHPTFSDESYTRAPPQRASVYTGRHIPRGTSAQHTCKCRIQMTQPPSHSTSCHRPDPSDPMPWSPGDRLRHQHPWRIHRATQTPTTHSTSSVWASLNPTYSEECRV